MTLILAFDTVQLTGLDGQHIDVVPMDVVMVRNIPPYTIIRTADGHYVAVQEDRETVLRRLEEG